MSFELEPASFVYLDLFPAQMVDGVNDTRYVNELRVIVTDNRLYVLQDTPDGPEMYFQEPLQNFSGTNKTEYRIETDSGVYYVTRAPNCGCGASLRGLRLFTDLPYIRPS